MQRIDELQCLIIFQYLLREMASEVRGIAIAMQPVDGLHLLIENQDILGSLVLGDLNIDIPSYDEFAFVLELEHLVIHPMQQLLQDQSTREETHRHEENHHCQQGFFVHPLLLETEDTLLLAEDECQ